MFKHNASKASKASKGTKKIFQKRGGGGFAFKGENTVTFRTFSALRRNMSSF